MRLLKVFASRPFLRGAQLRCCSSTVTGKASIDPRHRKPAVKFDSPQVATQGKANREVFRGWLVFKLLTYDFMVDNSLKLYSISKRVLGRWLTGKLLRATVAGQFLGGVDEQDTTKTVETLAKRNICSIWNYSVEQDLHEGESATQDVDQEEQEYERINQMYLKSIEMSASCNCNQPRRFIAIKLTAIVNPHVLTKLSNMVKTSREVFYSLATPSDNVLQRTVSMEQFNKEFPGSPIQPENDAGLHITDWMSHLPESILLISKKFPSLDFGGEVERVERFVQRIKAIGECASAMNVRVLVDAEQSYFEDAIHHLTVNYLMPRFNTEIPVIYSTLQTYLKAYPSHSQYEKRFPSLNIARSSYDTLLIDLATAKHQGFKYGVKVVRGAYMEQERKVSADLDQPCPVHPDKPSTDGSYHRALDHLLGEVVKGNAELMIATHNQETVEFSVGRMEELELSKLDGRVVFGQLCGMGDHLSYPLAQAGYIVNKVIVYGPMDTVIFYLIRRGQENRGIMRNAQRERELYAQELKRRLFRS